MSCWQYWRPSRSSTFNFFWFVKMTFSHCLSHVWWRHKNFSLRRFCCSFFLFVCFSFFFLIFNQLSKFLSRSLMIFISKSFRTIVVVFIEFFYNVSAAVSSGLPQVSSIYLRIEMIQHRKSFLSLGVFGLLSSSLLCFFHNVSVALSSSLPRVFPCLSGHSNDSTWEIIFISKSFQTIVFVKL